MKPATALPWTIEQIGVTDAGPRGVDGVFDIGPLERRISTVAGLEDAAYIAHACNAYPKLVEALREIVDPTGGWTNLRVDNAKAAADLLRSLGEE